MHKTILLTDALQLAQPLFIDVRSPSEYVTGHIQGAINIPLFTDEERAKVGTTYKQVSAEAARELGLEIVSPKLPAIAAEVKAQTASGRPIIVYCWRGGMRSKAVVTILSLLGINTMQLTGGYKVYRQYVIDSLRDFALQPQIVVLCGSTGVGKTTMLEHLARQNVPIIDLEKLANHRGSVFGQVGLGASSTAQRFDAALLAALQEFNCQPYIVVECESKRIGNVYLPDCLYQAMQRGRRILLHTGLEQRVSRLSAEYNVLDPQVQEEIKSSLNALSRRLGAKKTAALQAALAAGQAAAVISTLLTDYYDPLYGYEDSDRTTYDCIVNCDDLEAASLHIINYLEKLRR